MKKLSINIPDDADENELKFAISAMLFDNGLLSSGQAAEFAGVSKKTFLLNAGKYGVSVFGESAGELKADPLNL